MGGKPGSRELFRQCQAALHPARAAFRRHADGCAHPPPGHLVICNPQICQTAGRLRLKAGAPGGVCQAAVCRAGGRANAHAGGIEPGGKCQHIRQAALPQRHHAPVIVQCGIREGRAGMDGENSKERGAHGIECSKKTGRRQIKTAMNSIWKFRVSPFFYDMMESVRQQAYIQIIHHRQGGTQ